MARQAPDCAAMLDNVRRFHGDSESRLEDVERVLTDGYACVLLAEGERLRLRGRLEERAMTLGTMPAAAEVVEIANLATGIARADSEIEELRAALGDLAARVRRLRVA
jgi:citrate lyase beta subunit